MRGCGRRAKHLQPSEPGGPLFSSCLAACRMACQVSRTHRIIRGGGKKTAIIYLVFLIFVTVTTWTETGNTIQCAVFYKICPYFCFISCSSVALRNHTSQTPCESSAPLVFNPHRLKSHNCWLRSTVNALNGILIVKQ